MLFSCNVIKNQEIGFTKGSKSCIERVGSSSDSSWHVRWLEPLLKCQMLFRSSRVVVKEIFFLGSGLTITEINIVPILENVEHCGGKPEQAANMHMNRLSFTLKR